MGNREDAARAGITPITFWESSTEIMEALYTEDYGELQLMNKIHSYVQFHDVSQS